ncbi:uncharacterized protein MYCGRDRAFT_106525 [Zymoseptoria tritici IPO323]|uniref:Uncharacterized protein n=1 Tax=Zymoseptoria tritici (strain CBS 115943 / IPO323) TaxID=336722 RepID=F9XQ91_ZYMTI|nr:uncharacterized protein MYCGRDRAFT_106525 [Zymoseptoria tritici IPO323]EGP82695.1 hypothetical protein MYCGRDRAFT_106525 [Zymoseptoria tritici IPO323]
MRGLSDHSGNHRPDGCPLFTQRRMSAMIVDGQARAEHTFSKRRRDEEREERVQTKSCKIPQEAQGSTMAPKERQQSATTARTATNIHFGPTYRWRSFTTHTRRRHFLGSALGNGKAWAQDRATWVFFVVHTRRHWVRQNGSWC